MLDPNLYKMVENHKSSWKQELPALCLTRFLENFEQEGLKWDSKLKLHCERKHYLNCQ